MADFEQEKFELQKIHTKNIQELLDDTNHRLHKMESEYQAQAAATVSANTHSPSSLATTMISVVCRYFDYAIRINSSLSLFLSPIPYLLQRARGWVLCACMFTCLHPAILRFTFECCSCCTSLLFTKFSYFIPLCKLKSVFIITSNAD